MSVATLTPPAVRPEPRHRVTGSAWAWRAFLAVAALVGFGLHLYRYDKSYDLFIDESFYAELGQSVAKGHLPYATGVHFFLHPPGFFFLEAGWMKVFGLHHEVFAQVFSLRKLVALIAAATIPLLAVIVAKVLDRRAAVFVSVLWMVNAFVHRDSAIVILEPATIFFVLAGYAVLLHLAPRNSRRRRWQVLAAGLLFGYAVLCKEFGVFVTLAPMVFVFAFRWWLTRREAAAVAALSLTPYAIWVGVAAVSGNWHYFWFQFKSGFSRSAGASQISGFNRPGAPSFLDTILRNLSYLWTSYVILGLGSLAILYVAWKSRDARQRLVAACGLGALPLIIYCVLIGTNEEQFFNFLLAPALICLVVVAWTNWARMHRAVRVALIALTAAALVSDGINYAIVRTVADDGTYQLDKWMAENVPPHTTIAVTNGVQREVFLRYTMVDDEFGHSINPDVRYLVVFYKQVDEGYAFVDRPTIERQTRGSKVVFRTSDRSNGEMVVYEIR